MVSVSLSHRSGSLELGKRNVCGCIVQVQNGSNIRIDQVWPKPSLANSVWALRLLDGLFDRTEAVDSSRLRRRQSASPDVFADPYVGRPQSGLTAGRNKSAFSPTDAQSVAIDPARSPL